MTTTVNSTIEDFLTLHPEWRIAVDWLVMPPTAEEAIEEYPELAGSELIRHPQSMSSFGVPRLTVYCKARREHQTHRFAEMVATQSPPHCMTDKVFFKGMPCLHESMPERQLKGLLAAAKRHGYTPPEHAVYQSGLARYLGDPEAFVTPAMGRGYIKRLCESRGWACEGAVNVEHRQPEHDPCDKPPTLGNDIVARHASCMVNENPDLARLSKQQLRQRVLEKHGPRA